eukprot:7394604-Karenia_brevis.AAC.1
MSLDPAQSFEQAGPGSKACCCQAAGTSDHSGEVSCPPCFIPLVEWEQVGLSIWLWAVDPAPLPSNQQMHKRSLQSV